MTENHFLSAANYGKIMGNHMSSMNILNNYPSTQINEGISGCFQTSHMLKIFTAPLHDLASELMGGSRNFLGEGGRRLFGRQEPLVNTLIAEE